MVTAQSLLPRTGMAGPHDRIVFSLEQQEEAKSALDEEREKHKARWVLTSVLALQVYKAGGMSCSQSERHRQQHGCNVVYAAVSATC